MQVEEQRRTLFINFALGCHCWYCALRPSGPQSSFILTMPTSESFLSLMAWALESALDWYCRILRLVLFSAHAAETVGHICIHFCHRLAQRLLNIDHEIDHLTPT